MSSLLDPAKWDLLHQEGSLLLEQANRMISPHEALNNIIPTNSSTSFNTTSTPLQKYDIPYLERTIQRLNNIMNEYMLCYEQFSNQVKRIKQQILLKFALKKAQLYDRGPMNLATSPIDVIMAYENVLAIFFKELQHKTEIIQLFLTLYTFLLEYSIGQQQQFSNGSYSLNEIDFETLFGDGNDNSSTINTNIQAVNTDTTPIPLFTLAPIPNSSNDDATLPMNSKEQTLQHNAAFLLSHSLYENYPWLRDAVPYISNTGADLVMMQAKSDPQLHGNPLPLKYTDHLTSIANINSINKTVFRGKRTDLNGIVALNYQRPGFDLPQYNRCVNIIKSAFGELKEIIDLVNNTSNAVTNPQ